MRKEAGCKGEWGNARSSCGRAGGGGRVMLRCVLRVLWPDNQMAERRQRQRYIRSKPDGLLGLLMTVEDGYIEGDD